MQTASIVVDIYAARCSQCKCLLKDELATECSICGCVFDRVASNHAGLAVRFRKKRESAGVKLPTAAEFS